MYKWVIIMYNHNSYGRVGVGRREQGTLTNLGNTSPEMGHVRSPQRRRSGEGAEDYCGGLSRSGKKRILGIH
jgi:hypothetical protein